MSRSFLDVISFAIISKSMFCMKRREMVGHLQAALRDADWSISYMLMRLRIANWVHDVLQTSQSVTNWLRTSRANRWKIRYMK